MNSAAANFGAIDDNIRIKMTVIETDEIILSDLVSIKVIPDYS